MASQLLGSYLPFISRLYYPITNDAGLVGNNGHKQMMKQWKAR